MGLSLEDLNYDESFALLYGIMLGGGCLSKANLKTKFVAISCCIHDDLPFINEIIFLLLKKFRGRETKYKCREKYGVFEFNFSDKDLFDLISSFGFPIEKKGVNLKIPKIFFEKQLVKYVVAGYFATDGSLVLTKNPPYLYPRLEASSISKFLMIQVCDFLKEQGVTCKIYERKSKNWKWSQQYRIQANGRENLSLFIKKIGLVNPKHRERLKKL